MDSGQVCITMDSLSYDRLCSLLTYDAETGFLTWNTDRGNAVKAGTSAGTLRIDGYIEITIDEVKYLAHRLVWLYVHGYLPENLIDHVNRIPYDNRIENLRETSKSCNARNSPNRIDNTSGVKGVSFHHKTGKWQVMIKFNGKRHAIGYYADFIEAVCARLMVEQCINWSGCDSISPAYQYIKTIIPTIK